MMKTPQEDLQEYIDALEDVAEKGVNSKYTVERKGNNVLIRKKKTDSPIPIWFFLVLISLAILTQLDRCYEWITNFK